MHTIRKATLRKTLGDILGMPDAWPDYSAKRDGAKASMRGAWIAEFAESEGRLTIATRGGIDGPTLAIFFVEDAELLSRAARVLKVGMKVDAAVLLPI